MKSNSASRLIKILNTLRNNCNYIDNFKIFYKADPKLTPAALHILCYEGLSEIQLLYSQFKDDMHNSSMDQDQIETLLSGVKSIEDCIYPNQLGSKFRGLTETEDSLLSVCAAFLQDEGKLTKDDITSIRESIVSLRKLIEDSNISPTLRKVLLELVRLTEDAISRFNIHGAKGLKRALKSMLGEVAELYPNDIENESWKNTILGHLKLIDGIASRVLTYKPMIENTAQILISSNSI